MADARSQPIGRQRPRSGALGFTMVEMLVVLVIIVLLATTVMTVGRRAIESSKGRETSAVLANLEEAARQFAQDHPLSKVAGYRNRYGDYPPDELDGFVRDGDGIPECTDCPAPSPAKESKLSAKYLNLRASDLAAVKHGDIKAFALTVRLYNDAGTMILDRIQSKYRHAADDADHDGNPDEYLDADGDNSFTPDVDQPLSYFVDAWGTPLAYFAERPMFCRNKRACEPAPSVWDADSGNVKHPGDRYLTSQALFSLSNQVPVFVSYGPDGPEQFAYDFLEESRYPPDLIYDFNEEPPQVPFKIDNALNRDNIYSNSAVQEKILLVDFKRGVPTGGEG